MTDPFDYVTNANGAPVRVATVSVAAEYLGLSKRQVQRLGQEGKLFRCTGHDGKYRYEVPTGTEIAAPRAIANAGQTGGFAYLYDSQNKSPRYLIRNGKDGAIVNQMASRIHSVAYALGSACTLAEELEKRSIGAERVVKKESSGSFHGPPVMLHISTRDVHVGEPVDPQDYSDDIYKRVKDTLEWVSVAHGEIDEVVLTLGSDWLTVDNYFRSTTKGTAIPTFGSTYQIMRWAEELAISVINVCRRYCNTVVGICEQGNHDAVLSAAMARTCRAWFRNCDDVEIIIPECGGVRTHYQWHDVMLSGHHGHIRKPRQLPVIVASEEPEMWGTSSYRYILMGHRHHSQSWAMGDVGGCEIIQTRSPSHESDYEHKLGFIDDLRSLESFVFMRGRGLVTHRRQ